MGQSQVKSVRIFPGKNVINDLDDDKLVEEHPTDDCQDEPPNLTHDQADVRHGEDLARDDAGHAKRGDPDKQSYDS